MPSIVGLLQTLDHIFFHDWENVTRPIQET